VRTKRLLLWLGIAALAATILGATASAERAATVRVAVVTDIGGLNDRGFNHLSNVGLTNAKKRLGGIQSRIYVTQTANDRLPNLRAAAQAGYQLVIPVGVLFAFGPIDAVAPAFPRTKFAGVDVPWEFLSSKPSNVRGLVFKEQEAGYLAGYIAGLTIKLHPYKGKQIISGVGANKVDAIVRFLAGYRAGAKKANRRVKVLLNYANDPTFNDQAKCRETTLGQIARGSGIVFEAAGACGLGGLDAAKRRGVWAIGVDADQGYLGKHMLTSATKHVEVAVFDAIKAFKANPSKFRGGFNKVYSVKNGGVGYGKLSTRLSKKDRAFITKRVEAIRKAIAAGKIKPPAK
jgi:basic membrane protein A and related proteins